MIRKRLTCLSATIFVFCSFFCKAQHLVASTEIEKNVAGLHYGASINIESKRKFSIGGFYQCGIKQFDGTLTPVRKFYALQVQLPLYRCDKLAILVNTKTGLVDDQFLVFVPALITTVQLSPLIGLSFGSGIRMQNASLLAKLNITL